MYFSNWSKWDDWIFCSALVIGFLVIYIVVPLLVLGGFGWLVYWALVGLGVV